MSVLKILKIPFCYRMHVRNFSVFLKIKLMIAYINTFDLVLIYFNNLIIVNNTNIIFFDYYYHMLIYFYVTFMGIY